MSAGTSRATRRRLSTPERARLRRIAEGFSFIAMWMGLGYLFPMSAEAYLLMGVPLTIAFQVLVRRKRVRELWVRDSGADPFGPSRLSLRDLGVVTALAVAPLCWGLQTVMNGADLSSVGWYAAAIGGAAAAAYALHSTSVSAVVRSAMLPTLVGAVGNVLVVGVVQLATGASIEPAEMLGSVLKWLAIYFPATFVIEEVAFRGALDAHVHELGEGRGWQSAIFVSTLWGLWHLPVSDGMPFPFLVVSLVAWHCLVGVPLSLAWRRSGNLAGPAFAHAAMDAVRNALIGL
jgi:membrane protease YdiL (CAAX protease family)